MARKRSLLWVEVKNKSVTLRDGDKMPAPDHGLSAVFFGSYSVSRAEFARWSGITFPPGEGIYGLACDFAIISRYRKVVEETAHAVIEKKGRWIEVKA